MSHSALAAGPALTSPDLDTIFADPTLGFGQYPQGTSNAELMDATGSLMMQNYFDPSAYQFGSGF